jgi:hypothetical protein
MTIQIVHDTWGKKKDQEGVQRNDAECAIGHTVQHKKSAMQV